MFCTSCGTKNNEDGNFCKQCGVRLDRQSSTKISEQAFERAMPEDDQLTALLERAYHARKEGDRLGAISLCLQALAFRPNSTSCHSLLGQLYEQGGEHELAIEQYERVLTLNPGSIADRVKLDELRGDVPAVVSQKRAPTHIVLADSAKDRNPMDYRVPAFALAGVALMVLGGIFTMQFIGHQAALQRQSASTPPQIASANTGGATNTLQPNSQPGNVQTGANQTVPAGSAANPYSGFPGLSGEPPIIIHEPQPQYVYEPGRQIQPAPITVSDPGRNGGKQTGAGDNDDHQDSDRVILTGPDVATTSEVGGQAAKPTEGHGTVKFSNPANPTGGNVQASPSSSGSDSRKNEARAVLLSQQGQYKQAASAYISALDGAGEDTAYIYRQAAWCFEKAGEKTTAISYYNHGIDEAQKLVNQGRQVEIAKNLIRQCETGIKACSN